MGGEVREQVTQTPGQRMVQEQGTRPKILGWALEGQGTGASGVSKISKAG